MIGEAEKSAMNFSKTNDWPQVVELFGVIGCIPNTTTVGAVSDPTRKDYE